MVSVSVSSNFYNMAYEPNSVIEKEDTQRWVSRGQCMDTSYLLDLDVLYFANYMRFEFEIPIRIRSLTMIANSKNPILNKVFVPLNWKLLGTNDHKTHVVLFSFDIKKKEWPYENTLYFECYSYFKYIYIAINKG